MIFVLRCGINTNYRKQNTKCKDRRSILSLHITESRRRVRGRYEAAGRRTTESSRKNRRYAGRGAPSDFPSRTGRRRSVTAAKERELQQGIRRQALNGSDIDLLFPAEHRKE